MPRHKVEPRWKAGESGNPTGRPKMEPELKKACRALTPQIIERLKYWMEQSKDGKSSTKACEILLERGYGKCAQEIQLTGEDGASLIPSITINVTPKPEL